MATFDEKALEDFINSKLHPPAKVEVLGRERVLSELRTMARSRMREKRGVPSVPVPPIPEVRGRRNAR